MYINYECLVNTKIGEMNEKNSYNTNYTSKEKWINGQIWNGKNWKIALTRIKCVFFL